MGENGNRIKGLFFSTTPHKSSLFPQLSVTAAAPTPEKQTGHFNFVNLTCEQCDRRWGVRGEKRQEKKPFDCSLMGSIS